MMTGRLQVGQRRPCCPLNLFASCNKNESCPCLASSDNPTGTPSASASGSDTCGRRHIPARLVSDNVDDSSRSHWNCVWVDRHYEKRAWVSLECTADRLEHLFFGEHAQLPAITIGVMEPQAHVFRARGFRTDFVAWIFNIDVDLLQMSERLSQCCHVR